MGAPPGKGRIDFCKLSLVSEAKAKRYQSPRLGWMWDE
jgi:hypothetical protein